MKIEFEGTLERNEGGGSYIRLSREVSERFPGRGVLRVKGTVNGIPVSTSLMAMGGGTRCFGVHKATIERGGFAVGERLRVVAEPDDAPREVAVPADLARALGPLRAAFDALSYTHRKEHAQAILEAKKPETRARRIEKAVEMVAAGKKKQKRGKTRPG